MPSRKTPHQPRLCKTCDTEFVPAHGRQRYCVPGCRDSSYRCQSAAKDCPQCGESFVPTHGNALYCSDECRTEAWAYEPRAKIVNSCEWCGQGCAARRWCDDRCKHKAKYVPSPRRPKRKYPTCRVSQRPRARAFVAGFCRSCGDAVVVAPYSGGKQGGEPVRVRYCSKRCSKRVQRQAARARRRARQKAAEKTEPIFRRKVFERDNWTCRLCLKPVQQDALVPHPKAPTVDHILPLALGGSHTYTNVQCAHFICNSTKSHNVVQLSFAA